MAVSRSTRMYQMVVMDGDPTGDTEAKGLQEAEGVGVTPGGEFLAEPGKRGGREVGSDNGTGATLGDDFSLEVDDER